MGPCLNKVEQPTTITPEDLELEDWFNKLREINVIFN